MRPSPSISRIRPARRLLLACALLAAALRVTAAAAQERSAARNALLHALDHPNESSFTPTAAPTLSKQSASEAEADADAASDSQPERQTLPSAPKADAAPKPEPQTLEQLHADLISHAEALVAVHESPREALKYFRLAAILGHAGASSTAATLLLSSASQLPRDLPAAVRHLRHAAASDQPEAYAQLALLHASGLADRHGIRKSPKLAVFYWELAAASGSVYASTALAFRYLHGIGVPRSCPDAAAHYKRAATAIASDPLHWPTPTNFLYGRPPLPSGLINAGRVRLTDDILQGVLPTVSADSDIVQFYRHSAERGDTDAMTILGALALFGGHGIQPNEQLARADLHRAAAENHGEAHGILAHLAMRNHDNQTAYMHFRHAAASEGDRIGHYGLGMIFLHGLMGHQQDYSKAAMHFNFASDAKHAGASFQLGLLHWKGDGVEKSAEQAFHHFQNAARLGNLQSKLKIGVMHLEGTHPIRNPSCETAVEFLKEVAEGGEWRTMFELAMNSLDAGDRFGALFRNAQAAHAGIELAQFNVGLLLERSKEGDIPELEHWDRQRMITEAHEMYEFSGIQGYSESIIRSGHLAYLESEDYELAVRTYERGVEKNNPEAMFSLGMMHVQGVGVPQDRQRAVHYLRLAADVDESSAIPSNLALVGIRLYWFASDTWLWLSGFVTSELRSGKIAKSKSPGAVGERFRAGSVSSDGTSKESIPINIGFRPKVTNDLALMGFLIVFLIVVLLVRSKRLARQMYSRAES